MSKEVYVVKHTAYSRFGKRFFYDDIDHIFSSLSEASYACMDLAIHIWNRAGSNVTAWTYFSDSWNLEWGIEDPKYGHIRFEDDYVVNVFYVECVEMD